MERKMNVIIRPAELRDNIRIRTLQAEIARLHYEGRPELFRIEPRFYSDEEFCRIIGGADSFVMIADDGEYCELNNLAVIPCYRQRGIGGKLLGYAKMRATAFGKRGIMIAIVDSNEILKKWYNSNGFIETGKKRFQHLPFEVCFMKYDLI